MAVLENWFEVTRITFIIWIMFAVCCRELDSRRALVTRARLIVVGPLATARSRRDGVDEAGPRRTGSSASGSASSISTPATTAPGRTSANGTSGTSVAALEPWPGSCSRCAADAGSSTSRSPRALRGSCAIRCSSCSDASSDGALQCISEGAISARYYETSHPVLRRWIRLTLRRVDSVAVMGESLRWVFAGLVPDERIAVVPNGTPDPRPLPPTQDPHHVLFLSNLRRRKGVIEALGRRCSCSSGSRRARFTFAGSWESEELWRREHGRSRLGTTARCASGLRRGRGEGQASRRRRRSCSSRRSSRRATHVSCSRRWRPGVPVVTTDQGAIRETVRTAEAGSSSPTRTAVGLADRLTACSRVRRRGSASAVQPESDTSRRFTQEHADEALGEWLADVAR